MLLDKIKELNARYDIWSLFSDFFFIIGVVAFNWNPVLLILWFMVDTIGMLFFGVILFHKENKSWISTIGFILVSFFFIGLLIGLYSGIVKFIKDLHMEDLINTDPFQIINPVILPIILSCSILSHQASYSTELQRMKDGTYKSAYLKHFFLRYILIYALILFMIAFFVYFQIGIIVALIGIKAILRVFNKRIREIL